MRKNNKQLGTAQELVADFQNALVARATRQAAHDEANHSENELLQHLRAVSSGGYLQPGAMAADVQADVTRGSLDAHFKKVQAEQLDSLSSEQLAVMQAAADTAYIGRRVVATQPKGGDAIEAIWADERQGYRTSPYRRPTVTGTIEAVWLDRNVLIIKPSWQLRLLSGSLQNYAVYVIDPATAVPLVTIALP